MENGYDLRRSVDGKWEVFCVETGVTAVVGGLALTAFDRITANGVVGLLNRKIIKADGADAGEIGGPEDAKD